MTRRSVLILAAGAEGGLVVLALVLGAVFGVAPLAQLRGTAYGIVWGGLGVIPLLVTLGVLETLSWRPIVAFRERLHTLVGDLFARCTVTDLLVIAVLAGFCEEVFFRGLLQYGLVQVVGLVPAVLVASVVFGMAHFLSWTYAAYATLVGIYLGALFVVTGTLLAPVVTHVVYDFVALVYLVTRHPQHKLEHNDGPHH